jgi:hypothetical protein
MSAQPGKATKGKPERRRRRYPRYRSSFPVVVTLFGGSDYKKLDGHCVDLAEAGIGILLAAELNCGEVTSLKFTPSGSPHMWELRAVLRHRRGYHYGFEFLSLSGEDTTRLRQCLEGLERAD